MTYPQPSVRLTLPHVVATAIDLETLERDAMRAGIGTASYRCDGLATGIALACPYDFLAVLLGAARDAADGLTVSKLAKLAPAG